MLFLGPKIAAEAAPTGTSGLAGKDLDQAPRGSRQVFMGQEIFVGAASAAMLSLGFPTHRG
jgi:hypothetical protein